MHRAAIETLTEPGDVVLDPHIGGGTTLEASRLLPMKPAAFDTVPPLSTVTRTDVERTYDILQNTAEFDLRYTQRPS